MQPTVVRGPLDAAEIAALAGYHLEPRGACRGDVCVPLDGATRDDPHAMAAALGIALAVDDRHGWWAVGPEHRPRALREPTLPDLTVHDRGGAPFSLRSLIGRRGVLLAWASW